MNILFLTECEISPMLGGTERITATLSQKFCEEGHNVYSAYSYPLAEGLTTSRFTQTIKWDITQPLSTVIEDCLRNWQVDIVVCNYVRYKHKKKVLPVLYSIARKLNVKVVTCIHAMPGEDISVTSWHYILYRLLHYYDVRQALVDGVVRIFPKRMLYFLVKNKYVLIHQYCDKLVFLSERFYPVYTEISGVAQNPKFEAIPNALSFPLRPLVMENKEKKVLILARLHERSKRLSSALRIWKQIEQIPALNEWTLEIVGGGPDRKFFEKIARGLQLQRCMFLGRQPEIEPFYQKASLFMMTSSFEGFGITLTEAMQHGCVPLVFESYPSVHDIIQHDVNGRIIPDRGETEFVEAMQELMTNDKMRTQMAYQAHLSCNRFTQDVITNRWLRLFNSLV